MIRGLMYLVFLALQHGTGHVINGAQRPLQQLNMDLQRGALDIA